MPQGIVPEGKRGAGKPWSFEGVKFYRIYDRFICQSGAEVDTPLLGNSSTFKDDPGALAPTTRGPTEYSVLIYAYVICIHVGVCPWHHD